MSSLAVSIGHGPFVPFAAEFLVFDRNLMSFTHAKIVCAGEDMRDEVIHLLANASGGEAEFPMTDEHDQCFIVHDRLQRIVAALKIESECLADADHLIEPSLKRRWQEVRSYYFGR